MITQQRLFELFDYKDGNLYWKVNRQYIKSGSVAGTNRDDGYIVICVDQKRYRAHRLIFMFHNGYYPNEIDHIDGNPANNKIENLRESNRKLNMMNVGRYSTNTSGYKNISWNANRCKWQVRLRVNNMNKSFGYYEDLELADLVAQEARNKYHGEYANHGR